MLPFLPALVMLHQQVAMRQVELGNPRIVVQQRLDRLEPAKLSPKLFGPAGDQRWEFDWATWGAGDMGEPGVKPVRVRVFSQERKQNLDPAIDVCRMAMQIWDRAFHTMKVEAPREFNGGVVDFYLCFGGTPGGEQLYDSEFTPNSVQLTKVNTIYIYHLSSFKDPVEMAREVAHEYGHAILPAIGGFKAPEDWGNGYLGEKLFLRWFRDDMKKGLLTRDDAMGATPDAIDAWVKKNVDPLALQAATRYPEARDISEGPGGMDNFNGLALYTETICPPALFAQALKETAKKPPTDFPSNVVEVASRSENLTLNIPDYLMKQKAIWIPLGKGTCSGATVLERKNGWAKVGPLMPAIVIKNPPIG